MKLISEPPGYFAGGEILYGGNPIIGNGFYVEPTIARVKNDWEIVQKETFAPILYIIEFDDIENSINPIDPHKTKSSILCLENSHNLTGGQPLGPTQISELSDFGRKFCENFGEFFRKFRKKPQTFLHKNLKIREYKMTPNYLGFGSQIYSGIL